MLNEKKNIEIQTGISRIRVSFDGLYDIFCYDGLI